MAATDSSPPRATMEEPRVQLLSDALINKIAAGEVIERPASVVKELLENSVDAGATRVEIRVEDGGRSLISVLDDGLGMSRTDALMSLERHATSKLRNEGDLFRIDSLGFRGEALPSIAEVSRFELLTGTDGSEVGTRLVLDGGVWGEIEDAPNPGGTEIRVRRLFFNTPVRLKFLKTPRTEMHHVLDTVQRVALSRPNIALRLVSDGRAVIDVARDDTLLDRVRRVLGKAVSRGLHPITGARDNLRLEGLVSGPALHRSSRSSLFFFVNGRFVRDRTVVGALLAAYRDILPRGRYPVAVLFLDLPPEDVDVNVHPTKVEVRFRDSSEVWRFIGGTLSDFLEGLVDGPEVQGELPGTAAAEAVSRPAAPIIQGDGSEAPAPSPPPPSPWPLAAEPRRAFGGQEDLASRAMQRAVPGASSAAVASAVASAEPGPVLLDPLGAGEGPGPLPVPPGRAWPWAERLARREAAGQAWGKGESRPRLSRGELRGRFAGRWILWEASDELLLVDPVAAHRRLLFSNLQQGSATGR
ncbi:MAG: DNA mismatch repair endonuclease MutL, partial [Myxococcota bacterium]|nr:DNA mismatch repair endonuclease MutL [Myxococcota bacterium]